MKQRFIATFCLVSLVLVSQASATTSLKFTNQKAGASCAKSLLKKQVLLPNKHLLECQTSKTKPITTKWVDITKIAPKVNPFSLIAPDFVITQDGAKLVVSIASADVDIFLAKYPNGALISRIIGSNGTTSVSAPFSPEAGKNLTFTRTDPSGVIASGTWSAQVAVSLNGVQGDWSDFKSLIAPVVLPTPSASPIPTETADQINAKLKASSYLKILAFSRSGLIKQVAFSGFSSQDSTYAVDSLNVDWNAQALKSAKNYMALPGLSLTHAELLSQLLYEGFTQDQATFGASGLGGNSAIPAPIPSAPTTQNSGGCVPLIEPSYPIASQRISILGIQWVRDAQGYVTANATMRNDNSMNLRLVEYSFYYWVGTTRKSTSYNTGTSIVPKHFVKDDPAFMGIEQIAGSWTPGQVRTFAIQTNEILTCSNISFFSSDFVVSLGVGG
jgi:hypothetical protein